MEPWAKSDSKVLDEAATAASRTAQALSEAAIAGQKATASILEKARGPQLLLSGEAAAQAVTRLLPTAAPITVHGGFGPVELRPGTIWGGDRLLVTADTSVVHYTIRDGLYELGTSTFIRDELFRAMERAVAQAQLIVQLVQIEVSFLVALYGPWQALLGVSAASLGLTIHHRRGEVQTALNLAPRLIKILNELRERNPTLFGSLLKTAGSEILRNLPASFTAEDAAWFLGRVLHNVRKLPSATLGGIVRVVVRVAAIVIAVRLPARTADAVKKAAKEHAAELQARLAEAGIQVTAEEAEEILRETLANPETVKRLQQLEQTLNEAIPALERLSEMLHR